MTWKTSESTPGPASLRSYSGASGSGVKKHERSPVWHAGPSARTLNSSTSPSQSTWADETCRNAPDVSPLCHGACRERL